MPQNIFLRTSEKELSMLIGLERVTQPFLKDVGLHQFTVRQIVYKWRKFNTIVTLSRGSRPMKITPKARRTIMQDVTKNPWVMSKNLQSSLALANASVHESTIRKTLNDNGVQGKFLLIIKTR